MKKFTLIATALFLAILMISAAFTFHKAAASTQTGGFGKKHSSKDDTKSKDVEKRPRPVSGYSFTRDELKDAFDVVAQNHGALTYAFYTFTLEHKRPPENMEEFIESGHITVKMKDPYTGGDAFLGNRGIDSPKPGGLFYNKANEYWGEFEGWFINPNAPSSMRSFFTKIQKYDHKAIYELVFESDLSRDEQFTVIYLLQMDDAIEAFEQKIGRLPKSVNEMSELGDVNVDYINPFTGELAKHSEELSPGDYMYRTFTKDGFRKKRQLSDSGEVEVIDVPAEIEYYEVVGWGKDKPVYYYSNDVTKEEFLWDEDE